MKPRWPNSKAKTQSSAALPSTPFRGRAAPGVLLIGTLVVAALFVASPVALSAQPDQACKVDPKGKKKKGRRAREARARDKRIAERKKSPEYRAARMRLVARVRTGLLGTDDAKRYRSFTQVGFLTTKERAPLIPILNRMALSHKDVRTRRKAIVVIGRLRHSTAEDILIKALKDEDSMSVRYAALALRRMKSKKDPNYRKRRVKARTFLTNKILYASATERRKAIRSVERLEKEERKPYIVLINKVAIEDRDPLTRRAAIDTLGRIRDERSEATLLKALKDKNERNARAAGVALGKMNSKKAAAPLLKMILKQDFSKLERGLESMIRALASIEGTTGNQELLAKLKDSETKEELKQTLILFLGKRKHVAAGDFLVKRATDDDAAVTTRAYAVNALGHFGRKKDIKPLREILEKIRALTSGKARAKRSRLRMQIIVALVRLGDPKVQVELVAAAKDDDPNVRARAVKQLGELKVKSARPMLCFKYKYDPSRKVRGAARRAILELDGKAEKK